MNGGPEGAELIAALDVGTSCIKVVVAERTRDGAVSVIGMGIVDAEGMRRGVVVHPRAVACGIRQALADAELTSGVRIGAVRVALSGAHICSVNSRGVIAVGGQARRIAAGDVRRAIDAASAIVVPADRRILSCLPQEFVVDDQDGVIDPEGMSGARLEVNLHIITGSLAAIENLLTCVLGCGVAIDEAVVGHAAAGLAVLSQDEKALGTALVDVGGGTTSVAVFERGALSHTFVLPVGGMHLTTDLAVGLRTPVAEAERMKRRYARAMTLSIDSGDTIAVPDISGSLHHDVPRQIVTDIACAWTQALLERVWGEIRDAGYSQRLAAGVVFTGGGSAVRGLLEAADAVCGVPVRRASPAAAGSLADLVNSPAFATATGVVLHASSEAAMPARTRPRIGGWRSLFRVLHQATH